MNAIADIMKYETAGDPVSGCKWTRKTTGKIAKQLKRIGIKVSANTVGRLLKKMDFSLRVNIKCLESGLKNPPPPRKRNQQFQYIRSQIRDFNAHGLPVISVDTKSRELIGPFYHQGAIWSQAPVRVLDHDFPSDALGVAIPYGIYDFCRNQGFVYVGTSRDTAEFAVDAIGHWWQKIGSDHYSKADHLLILADCGGSNSYRTRLWKDRLQNAFCSRFKLFVKVCHYPPGASKWNPIEHKMFSFISNNWAGRPLANYETALKFIRTTKTTAGLRIRATLNTKKYERGIKVSDKQMQNINLKRYTLRPEWNYSISP
jgi:hypothetical protein